MRCVHYPIREGERERETDSQVVPVAAAEPSDYGDDDEMRT